MKAPSKNYLNLILALGFGIAWAFFWALDRTLAYVLFGGACFFLVLFFYNRFASTDEHSGNYDKSGSHQSHQYQSGTSVRSSKTQRKPVAPGCTPSIQDLKGMARTVVIVTLTVLGAAFFYFIWNTSDSQQNVYPYEAYTRAEEFYALKQYDSAFYYYRYACNNDEALDEAWLGLGNTHYMRLQYDSALYFYKKASAVDEEAFQPKYSIAWWYYARQQYQRSIDEISLFQDDYAQQADLWQLLGDNYYELSQYDEALVNYEQAYALGNRSRWLCHVMAYLYDKKADVQRAIPLYQEALTFDNELVEIHTRLGELLPGTEGESYRRRAAELQLSKGR